MVNIDGGKVRKDELEGVMMVLRNIKTMVNVETLEDGEDDKDNNNPR